MADLVKLKRSAVAAKTPTTSDLDLGELAINTNDGKLFLKKDNGTASVVEIGAIPSYLYSGTITTAPSVSGSAEDVLVIGDGASASNTSTGGVGGSIIVGKNASLLTTNGNPSSNNIVIGSSAKLKGLTTSEQLDNNIAIGTDAGVEMSGYRAYNSVFIGYGATGYSGSYNVLSNGIAIGQSAKCGYADSIAIGVAANNYNGVNCLSLGYQAISGAVDGSVSYAVAVGSQTTASATSAMAIGTGITNNVPSSVLLGTSGCNLHLKENGRLYLSGTAAQYVAPSYTTGNEPTGVAGGIIFDTTQNRLCVYNGSSWDLIEAGASGGLDGLNDVVIQGTPVNGEVLTYDGSISSWVNFPLPTADSPVWGGIIGDLEDQTDLDTALSAKIDKSLITNKGQLIAGSNTAEVVVVSTGSNGQILTTDLTEDAGVKWINRIKVATPTFNTTMSVDVSGFVDIVRFTMTGNTTLGFHSGVDGQKFIVEITQDGTGSRILSFDSSVRLGTDISSVVLTTTANKTDRIGFIYNSTAGKYDVIAVIKGF